MARQCNTIWRCPLLLSSTWNSNAIAEISEFIERSAIAGQLYEAVTCPFTHRPSYDHRLVRYPDDLDVWAPAFYLSPDEPFGTASKQRLASIFVAPGGFGIPGVDVCYGAFALGEGDLSTADFYRASLLCRSL